jgi:sn-glycerol 3-phosphate transport system substrate-binding protein
MPFNSSSPILYYNKDAFKKAGLPDKAPTTWSEVGEFSKKILGAGAAKCGFTTSWPSWTMLENTFPWHDQPFATNQNGYQGLDTKLLINNEFGLKHIGQLAAWQKENIYSYGGRMGQPDPKFINGDCAMLVQSSAVIGGFKKSIKQFAWGTGQLPHWGAPYKKQNAIVGGGTLWVLRGRPAAEYKGVGQFMKFISEPKQQAWWAVTTGYVPITHSAIKGLEEAQHFKKNPEQWTALSQLSAAPTANSQGVRLGNFVQIREAIESELEEIFAGKKSAKEGLDAAVAKGNEILKEFAAANKP